MPFVQEGNDQKVGFLHGELFEASKVLQVDHSFVFLFIHKGLLVLLFVCLYIYLPLPP